MYAGSMTGTHPPTVRLTNVEIGRLIGLDHTSVSRLRRGERRCSIAVMVRIEDQFGWPVRDQFAAMADGTFEPEFERRTAEFAASTRPDGADDTSPPS